MPQPKAKTATCADIEALPENMVGEILFGALHTHPRPAPRHARATSTLGFELGGPFDRGRGGPGGWIILDEPELHLGPHVVVPDLAGWRRERTPKLPDTAYFEVAPDWVAEVLSPSTAQVDRTDKLAIYATFKVAHAWYVDPDARTLEEFALSGDKWLIAATFKDDEAVTAPPFEVHTFTLDALWEVCGPSVIAPSFSCPPWPTTRQSHPGTTGQELRRAKSEYSLSRSLRGEGQREGRPRALRVRGPTTRMTRCGRSASGLLRTGLL